MSIVIFSMIFCPCNKIFFLFVFSFLFLFFLWSDIFIQELPENTIPEDFPTGWYKSEDGHFFFNQDADIYISTSIPVDKFNSAYQKLSPAELPSSFTAVDLIPQSIEGHALSAELSIVESFNNVNPIFSKEMGLLAVTLLPGHDHFQNHCNIINIPILKNNERFIYFIRSFSPTNLKIAPGGNVIETFSYLINDFWVIYGNIPTSDSWILGTLQPDWFDKKEDLRDLYFMINDQPTEYALTTHYFLIDGLFILSDNVLFTDMLAPNVDTIAKTYRETVSLISKKFCFLLAFFIAFSFVFSVYIGRYLYVQPKGLL